jgi:hypothetical protein
MKINCSLQSKPSQTTNLMWTTRVFFTLDLSPAIQPWHFNRGSIMEKHLGEDSSIANTRQTTKQRVQTELAELKFEQRITSRNSVTRFF